MSNGSMLEILKNMIENIEEKKHTEIDVKGGEHASNRTLLANRRIHG